MTTTSATRPVSVSDYAGRIGRAVRQVGGAVVEGEVQKPRKSPGGLLYFDLTDGEAKLCCKVFGRQVDSLSHTPEEGDLVQVTVERPDFWPAGGKLDMIAADVELAGEGELLRRRAELLRRLKAEGLCDESRRKPLPSFPRAVGLIAGKGSDGRSDVIRALRDRFAPVHIVTCDAVVQGKAAPRDIIDALVCLQEHQFVDVIIIARGGGSTQDLVAFDDERLCRALFACDVPVVAAIGHSDNAPVCNHVTHAAYTPSRSAELAVPSVAELRQHLTFARQTLDQVPFRIDRRLEQLAAMEGRLRATECIEGRAREVVDLSQRIESAETQFFSSRATGLLEARAAMSTIPIRAGALLSERERELGSARRELSLGTGRIRGAASEVAEQIRRLGLGILRQLADHERDYGRALARLTAHTKETIIRRLGDERDRIDDLGDLARERAGRRLTDAAREARHATALIDARDYRRRGFVLVADAARQPVSSAAALRRGTPLTLSFRDGQAKTIVSHVEEQSP